MPLIEKGSTEAELRAQIARLDLVMSRNPAMSRDLITRKEAAQRELDNLLLSQPGYKVVNTDAP